MLLSSCFRAFTLVAGLALAGLASAQSAGAINTSCTPSRLQFATSTPTLEERACSQLFRLLRPGMLARGAAAAALGEWRNSPNVRNQDVNEMTHRFASFYARHSAQGAGELLAGYLNHEDPLKHASGLHGNWNRIRFALLSVVETTNGDGRVRPAFASLAGSLSSGMTSIACYRYPGDNGFNEGLKHSAAVYSSYFVNALFREFKPDLSALAYRARHHKQ